MYVCMFNLGKAMHSQKYIGHSQHQKIGKNLATFGNFALIVLKFETEIF